MKKILYLLIASGILLTATCYGQFDALNLNMTVGPVQPRFTMYGDSAPFTSKVSSNVPYPVSFKFNVTIKGDGALLGQSDLTVAPTYTCINFTDTLKNLDPFDGAMAAMTSYSGFRDSINAGVMPYHSYEYCVNLVDAVTHTNITTIECYDFTIQAFAAPVLAFPENTDTLSNHSYRVRFHWHPVNPLEKGPTYYKLTVVPVLSGQTSAYALAHNTPSLVVDSLRDSSYSWHQRGDSIIEHTHYRFPVVTYAWQVKAYYITGTSFGSSSIFSFTMGNAKLVSQGGAFSDSIASLNAKLLEFPGPQIPEYDSLQKTAYNTPAYGPWTLGENKTYSCDNGNWEDGTTDNWTPWLGFRNYGSGPDIVLDTQKWDNPGPHSRLDLIHATIPPTYDPWVGSILPQVLKGGSYSMRLGPDNLQWVNDSFGNPDVYGVAQALDYDVALTDTPKVKFWYALVLQHGGHYGQKWSDWLNEFVIDFNSYFAESEFIVRITGYFDTVGLAKVFVPFKKPVDIDSVYANIRDPAGLSQIVKGPGDTVDYKNWSCKRINLPATAKDIFGNTITLANQTVTVQFITSNCILGGHFGYAYIDGLCDNSDPTTCSFTLDTASCPNTDIVANGSASFGAQSYYWSVQQCSANGDTLFGTQHTIGWVKGQPAVFEVSSWMKSRWNSPLVPGDYYKVKLVIRNDCDDSVVASHVIHIRKLYAIAGSDQYMCSGSLHSVALGGTMVNPTGTAYSWTSIPSGFTSSLANPTSSPTSTTTYILSVSYSTCVAVKDTIKVNISNAITAVSINQTAAICNGYTLTLNITPSSSFTNVAYITWTKSSWTGTVIGHGISIHVSGDTTQSYYVKVADLCGDTVRNSVFVTANNFSITDPSEYIICPSGFIPSYGNLKMPEFGLSWGEVPAYGAARYTLQVYNDWGEMIYDVGHNPVNGAGFYNGEVNWSGNIYDWTKGDSVAAPMNSYLIMVNFFDCDHTKFWEANFYAPPGCPDTGPPWNQDSACQNVEDYWITLTR